MPEGHIVNVLLNELQESIKSDEVVLPTLPEIALKTQRITEDPDAILRDVAEVVRTDAAMAARLIKVANSPLIRANTPASDISTAIMRLGLNFSCNLITGLAIEQMFHSQTAVIEKKLRHISKISTAVAGRASVLAKHFSELSPDEVALAGIVHLIGMLPILTFLDDKMVQNQIDDRYTEQIDGLLWELHADLGYQILHNWGFKRSMAMIPTLCQQYDKDSEVQLETVDFIILARLLTMQEEGLLTPDIPTFDQIRLFNRIGIEFKPGEKSTPELDALEEQFQGAIQAFSG